MKTWKQVKLGDLLSESKVESINPDCNRRIKVKLNIGGVEKRPIINDKDGATKYYIRKAGQFIYGRQNLHKGAFGIIPPELDGYESSSDIPAFDVSDKCYPEWIFYFFKQGSFYLKLDSLARGIGSKRINAKQIFELNISLPPKSEQKKIIESINQLERNSEILRREFDYQLILLSNLKSTTLREAVQGLKTEEWRSVNQTQMVASYLKEIKSEKEKYINSKRQKLKSFQKITSKDFLFAIPSTWTWCRFQEIASIESNLIHPSKYPKLPHIAPDNIEKNSGKLLKYRTVEEDNLISAKHHFYPGQILYSKIRPHLNKVVEIDFEGLCSADMYPIKSFIDRSFLFCFMLSDFFVSQAIKSEGRVAMPKINQNELNKIIIAIPPLEEQKLIGAKVKAIIAFTENLEKEILKNRSDAVLLENTILTELLGDIANNSDLKTVKILPDKNEVSSLLNIKTITRKSPNNMENIQDLYQEISIRFGTNTFYFKDIEDLFAVNYEESKDVFFDLLNAKKIKYEYDIEVKTFRFSLI